MLMLTENASSVIGALVDSNEMPEGSGLRIANAPEGLTVAAAESPETGDEVVEDRSVRVFVEPSAATALGDMMLDAHVDDDGRVQFLLAQQ